MLPIRCPGDPTKSGRGRRTEPQRDKQLRRGKGKKRQILGGRGKPKGSQPWARRK